MNAFFNSADSSPLTTLKEDVKTLGKDVTKLAQEHIVAPAATMVRDAQQSLHQGTQRAQDVIIESIDSTRKVLAHNVADAQKNCTRMRDSTAAWISANPLTSVGIAAIAGMALTSIGARRQN